MDSNYPLTFSELLKTFRLRGRMSQQQLAAQLDVHRNTVGAWERGDRLPDTRGMVLELARHLRLDEEETRNLLEASLTAVSAPWNVPFTRNPFFTGRERALAHLHTLLSRQSPTAARTSAYGVRGLGGMGKTQLAVEYAYRYRSEYTAVLWVEAETWTTVLSSYLALAGVLGLPEQAEQHHSLVVKAVLRWFNRHKEWLLIYDNVEDVGILKHFLPTTGQGSLLMTTHLQSLGTLAQTVELSPMTLQEGYDFLLARTQYFKEGEQAAAQELVHVMGGLPLALEQAGAYVEASRCSLSDYLQLYRYSEQCLLAKQEASSDHPLSVSRTFALAFERLESGSPLAADLLKVCAFLAPDAIPDSFFLQGAARLGPTLQTIATNRLRFYEGLKALLAYSLLWRDGVAHTVTIHRLVQVVLKGLLPKEEQRSWRKRVLKAMSQLFPAEEETQVDYWSACQQWLSHAKVCLSDSEPGEEELSLPLMSHVASYLSKNAQYVEAESLFGRVIQMGKQALGPKHPLIAEALHGLAELFRVQSQYEKAEPLYQQALGIREQTLGSGHPDTQKIVKDYAAFLRLMKREPAVHALEER